MKNLGLMVLFNALVINFSFASGAPEKAFSKGITHKEYRNRVRKAFSTFDRDHTGKLDKKECSPIANWCVGSDKNKDSEIDRSEFLRRAEKDFRDADKNKDGSLDQKEASGLILLRF